MTFDEMGSKSETYILLSTQSWGELSYNENRARDSLAEAGAEIGGECLLIN